MQGWQWLYIIEAAPAIVLRLVSIVMLDDGIDRAKWLSREDKTTLTKSIYEERAKHVPQHGGMLTDLVASPKLYVLAFAYFAFICGTYAVNFWLPTMLKASGATKAAEIGWLSAVPYGISAMVMVLLSRSLDRRMERRWHTAIPTIAGGAALAIVPNLPPSLP